MTTADPNRLTFCLEWYDTTAFLKKKFLLSCYADDSVELFDVKNQRMFLKRNKCPGVLPKDIFVGAYLTIYQRQMEVVDYGDEHTRKKREKFEERTLAMIKPDTVDKMGVIFDVIADNGLMISKIKMAQMNENHVLSFYQQHKGQSYFPALINYITSGPVLAMELVGENAIDKWNSIMGPKDAVLARSTAPETLRARFGKTLALNGVHGADSPAASERERKMLFPCALDSANSPPSSAQLNEGVACCVIKPHAVKEDGVLSKIVNILLANGFVINALQMFQLDLPNAEEFLEVYKGLMPCYKEMIEELCSGPCVVMEISGFELETQKKLRELVGPWDPSVAKRLRPNTLRSKFGVNQYQNAVHCTDLPEDGLMECEFFFCLLQQSLN